MNLGDSEARPRNRLLEMWRMSDRCWERGEVRSLFEDVGVRSLFGDVWDAITFGVWECDHFWGVGVR